jgi:ATP-dependent protease HslVU (ClpYQ) peptidase subunit
MTTIAYKDGIIAADTQITYDKSVRGKSSPKIVQLAKDLVFAGAGDTRAISSAMRFFSIPNWEEKIDESPKFKQYFEALLWYKGKIYFCIGGCYPEPLCDDFYALGSGYKFALAALHLGLSAEEAVKFASTLDIYTNNEIQLFNVAQLQEKATKPKRAR